MGERMEAPAQKHDTKITKTVPRNRNSGDIRVQNSPEVQLLLLQRLVGNQGVQRLVEKDGSPVQSIIRHSRNRAGTIQRWEASEHNYLAEQVYRPDHIEKDLGQIFGVNQGKAAGGKVRLKYYQQAIPYSEVSALADLYETYEDMYNAPAAEIEALLETIKKERAILIKDKEGREITTGTIPQQQKRKAANFLSDTEKKELTKSDKAFTDATGARYIDLAKKNAAHFTHTDLPNQKNNFVTWEIMHQEALAKAAASQKKDIQLGSEAYLRSSFADHYLADTFALGHLTGKSKEDDDIRQVLLKEMAEVISEVLAEKGKWTFIIPGVGHLWAFLSIVVGEVLSGRDDIQKLPDKIIHDLDNERGRLVKNAQGTQWIAYGDKRLLAAENQPNLDKSIEAMNISKQELLAAFNGNIPGSFKPEKLYPVATAEKRKWNYQDARAKMKSIILNNFSMLEILWTEDDLVRAYINRMSVAEVASLSVDEKARSIRTLLDGYTGTADERAILKVLQGANQNRDITAVVDHPKVGLDLLVSDIHGEEYNQLLAILKVNYFKTMPIQTKQKLLLRSAKGYTFGWEEKLVKVILESSSATDYVELIKLVDTKVSSESDDFIVDSFKDSQGRLQPAKVPSNLTAAQTVTLCKALISGACVGDDETAVLLILRKQTDAVFQKAVYMLTIGYIDSGLDGTNWDTFLVMCAHRYPAGQNYGAKLIYYEKNDDAARMLINGGNGELPIAMDKLSPDEWIGIIKALLSGNCGDDDEDVIIVIVRYLVNIGHAGLVHYSIGPSEMDRGVDGKQWNIIREIMKKAGYDW